MDEQLDVFIDQFYGKYSPNDIPQGDRRTRLKEKLRADFDGYVGQMYGKYAPDNIPDAPRLASLKGKYLAQQTTQTAPQNQQVEPVNKGEVISTAIGSVSPATQGLFDFGRTLYSGLTDTAPQTAAQTLEVARTALNPSNVSEFVRNDRPVDFQRYVRDKDPKYSGIGGFFTPFDMDEAVPKYGTQFMEDEGLSSEITAMEERLPKTIERRKGVEQYVQQQKQEAEEKLGGVVTDYRNIDSVGSFASYVGNLLGQTAYQIPLSVGTRGASSYAMEAATVYDNQLDRLAKEHGISREEVIKRNLDDPAAGQAYAMLAGGLDAASAGNLINAFRKGGGTILKKWINITSEALTEPAQGVLEEVGGGSPLEESFSEEGMSRRVNELFGGLVGGAAFSIGGAEQSVKSKIKSAESQIDQAVNEIGDTGDPQLNADIDAAASIDPVDKQVLEEVKVAEAIQEEQKEVEAEEKLQKELEGGTESTEDAENTKTNTAKEAEIKPTERPEWKAAVKKVEDARKRFADLPIDASREESMRLALEITDARQELQKLIEVGPPRDVDTQHSLFDALDQKMKVTDSEGNTGTLKLDAGGKLTLENSKKIIELGNLDTEIDPATSIRDFGLTLAKAPKQREEKSVKMTPNEAIKHQVQTFYKGMDKGVKRGKELTNELVTKVQEAIKDSPLKPKQISSILNRVKNTNLFTPGSISRLNNFIDKVTQDAEYADKLGEAKSLNNKLRKLSKSSSSNLQNYKTLARSFASINPEDTFINPHLEMGNKILKALTSPTSEKYAPVDVAEAQAYITDLQDKIEEFEEEQIAKEPDGDKRNLQLFATLGSSLEALNDKDLSSFDESEVRTIETLKTLDPARLTDAQATAVVRVIDNIVENDDFSNAGAVEPIIKSKQNLDEIKKRLAGLEKKEIGIVGKIGANIYQQFTRIFSDSGVAAEIQRLSGILDVFNAGSRVENQEIKLTKVLKDKIKEVNKKYKIKVQDLPNQVRLVIFSELYKNYGDNSHINKVKGNIQRTIAEYEKTDPEVAETWKQVYADFANVTSTDEALEVMDKGLFEIWKFFNERFATEINPRLGKLSNELYNKPYVEANNYSHTDIKRMTDTTADREAFVEGNQSRTGKVKGKQAKTAITATRSLPQGYGYTSDFLESQLRGYRDSLYDIEASKPKQLVFETIYTPEFEEAVGGMENAKIVRQMVARSEEIQRGMSRATSNDAVKFLDKFTQYLRSLGAIRALASLSQPIKQVPSVWSKAFFNHVGSGSTGAFIKGIGAVNLISTSPNLRKLFDLYTIGVRGERLGGIERGDSVGYRLSSHEGNRVARAAEWLRRQSDTFGRTVLQPLTKSDVYAARTTWLGYYLQKLQEQGVTKVDLNSEFEKQNDPVRQAAAAFAEQMLAETQVPSNPATLAQLVRNENDGGWNFAKNLLIPFSTFSLTAKYRSIVDVGKFLSNPSKRNASAVAGDVFEIAAYSGIAYGLLPFYKDWLKAGIEELFGFEGGDEDDPEKKKKALYSNLVNAAVPFAVGAPGEAGVAYLANRLAWVAENPDASYGEWKKETGGFVYQPESFDAGVFALGVMPFSEAASGVIDLASGKATYDAFGQTREVELSKEQQRLLVVKTMMEMMGIVGIQEADIYNQVKKVYKEQLKGGNKGSSNRATPRPIPRPRPRPLPAPNLR